MLMPHCVFEVFVTSIFLFHALSVESAKQENRRSFMLGTDKKTLCCSQKSVQLLLGWKRRDPSA